MSLVEESIHAIEEEYSRLGYTLGWRFLMTPAATLSAEFRTLVLTLNPGGTWEPPDHPRASFERGSAYRLEAWPTGGVGSPFRASGAEVLQRQVQLMFEWLGESIDETPTGYFVPFRSPSWKALPRRDEAEAFGCRLWRPFLEGDRAPSLVLCIGLDQAFTGASRLVRAAPRPSMPIGWGSYSARIASSERTMVIGFPHLSRFAIFGRPDSHAPLVRLRQEIEAFRASLAPLPNGGSS